MKEYEPLVGEDVAEAAQTMVALADIHGEPFSQALMESSLWPTWAKKPQHS